MRAVQYDQPDSPTGDMRSLDVDDKETNALLEKRHEQEREWPFKGWLAPVWLHVLGVGHTSSACLISYAQHSLSCVVRPESMPLWDPCCVGPIFSHIVKSPH